jgi:acyl dehydratase
MLKVVHGRDLAAHIGEKLGSSGWVTVDQAMIDQFAEATGDHQWIHVDTERAKKEMPGGQTLAHGYLTLSLLPRLMAEIWQVEQRTHALNYGANRVRFTAPVRAGSQVRAHGTLLAVTEIAGGVRVIVEATLELAGSERPALVAEVISQVYG